MLIGGHLGKQKWLANFLLKALQGSRFILEWKTKIDIL